MPDKDAAMIPRRAPEAAGPVRCAAGEHCLMRMRLAGIAGIAGLVLALSGSAFAADDGGDASSGALFPTHPTPPPHPTPGLPATSLANGIPLTSDDGRDPRFGSMPEPDFGGE